MSPGSRSGNRWLCPASPCKSTEACGPRRARSSPTWPPPLRGYQTGDSSSEPRTGLESWLPPFLCASPTVSSHPRISARKGALDLIGGFLEDRGRLARLPATLRLPVVRCPLAGLDGLGREDHQRRDELVLAEEGVLHRGPVDDLVDRLAARIALVGLVPAPLVGSERRDDARLLRRRAKRLRAGMPVDHGEQDVAPAPRVAVVARECVVAGLVFFHSLRDQEPLERSVGLEDRLGLEPSVEAFLPIDVAGLLIHVLVGDGHAERRLVRV